MMKLAKLESAIASCIDWIGTNAARNKSKKMKMYISMKPKTPPSNPLTCFKIGTFVNESNIDNKIAKMIFVPKNKTMNQKAL